MTVTQRLFQWVRRHLEAPATVPVAMAALLFLCAAGLAQAADIQKRSLLTTDGTLFQARAGRSPISA